MSVNLSVQRQGRPLHEVHPSGIRLSVWVLTVLRPSSMHADDSSPVAHDQVRPAWGRDLHDHELMMTGRPQTGSDSSSSSDSRCRLCRSPRRF